MYREMFEPGLGRNRGSLVRALCKPFIYVQKRAILTISKIENPKLKIQNH